jgi:hypothetical protein
MTKQGAPIPIPENWDELTDAEKRQVTAQLLKGVADQAGIDRSGGGTDGAGT